MSANHTSLKDQIKVVKVKAKQVRDVYILYLFYSVQNIYIDQFTDFTHTKTQIFKTFNLLFKKQLWIGYMLL